jgi:hypothetical protein
MFDAIEASSARLFLQPTQQQIFAANTSTLRFYLEQAIYLMKDCACKVDEQYSK